MSVLTRCGAARRRLGPAPIARARARAHDPSRVSPALWHRGCRHYPPTSNPRPPPPPPTPSPLGGRRRRRRSGASSWGLGAAGGESRLFVRGPPLRAIKWLRSGARAVFLLREPPRALQRGCAGCERRLLILTRPSRRAPSAQTAAMLRQRAVAAHCRPARWPGAGTTRAESGTMRPR